MSHGATLITQQTLSISIAFQQNGHGLGNDAFDAAQASLDGRLKQKEIPGILFAAVMRAKSVSYLKQNQNIIWLGGTGCGKTLYPVTHVRQGMVQHTPPHPDLCVWFFFLLTCRTAATRAFADIQEICQRNWSGLHQGNEPPV